MSKEAIWGQGFSFGHVEHEVLTRGRYQISSGMQIWSLRWGLLGWWYTAETHSYLSCRGSHVKRHKETTKWEAEKAGVLRTAKAKEKMRLNISTRRKESKRSKEVVSGQRRVADMTQHLILTEQEKEGSQRRLADWKKRGWQEPQLYWQWWRWYDGGGSKSKQ